ncbi:MAG: hypothetical protein WD342_19060 [Verrucomicrobiales bacterium]
MPEPAASLDTRAAVSRMADFSGRLSPMLVKELRQGMRTNLFTVAFILLQVFMVLCLAAGLVGPGSPSIDVFFWFFIVVTLLAVQPLRGFNALSSEHQLNTLELIQMTRLDGWRITLGKWTAINAQSLLFITGVLPYLVIRYFLGNVNFVADLVGLGFIGLGSALATAMTVGVSVFKNIVLRAILVVGMGIALIALTQIVGQTLLRGGLGSDHAATLALLFLGGCYGCFCFLSFGASRIAPLSENHATRKRLVALGVALLGCLFLFTSTDETVVLVFTGLVLALACADALTEPLPIFSRVLRPFRKNAPGRAAALFLAPGWIAGLGFFVVSALFWLGIFKAVEFTGGLSLLDDTKGLVTFLSLCNLLIFPLLVIHLFFAKQASNQFTFGVYTFIQCSLAMLTLLMGALAAAVGQNAESTYLWFPVPSVLLTATQSTAAENPLFLFFAVATTALCFFVPLLRHPGRVREFRRHLKPAD